MFYLLGSQLRLTKNLSFKFSDVKEMFLKYPLFVRYKDHLDPIGPDEEDETRLFALLLSHVDRAIEK